MGSGLDWRSSGRFLEGARLPMKEEMEQEMKGVWVATWKISGTSQISA